MPVIPIASEQQRINVSSPVPIGASESGRIMDEAVSRLGGAITDLGLTLAKADSDSKRSMAIAKAKDIGNQYDMARKKLRAILVNSHQSTGITSFSDEMARQSKDLAESFLTEVEDPLVQRFLTTNISDIDNDSTTIELEQSLKLYNQSRQNFFNKEIGGLAQKARGVFMEAEYTFDEKLGRDQGGGKILGNRVTDNLDDLLTKVSDAVDKAELPANQREAIKLEKKREVIEAAINGLTDQRNDRGYEDALKLLKRFTTGQYDETIFDTKAAEKKFDDIQQDWRQQTSIEEALRKKEKERREELKEMVQAKNAAMFRDKISKATTQVELKALMDSIYAADIAEPDRNALLGFKREASKERNDRVVSDYIGKMTMDGATPALMREISMLYKSSDTQLLPEGHEELMRAFNFTKNEANKERIAIYRNNADIIDAYGRATISDSSDLYKREKAIMLENLKRKYFRLIIETTDDAQKIFDEQIVPQLPELNLKFIPGRGVIQSLDAYKSDEAKAIQRKVIKSLSDPTSTNKDIDKSKQELQDYINSTQKPAKGN